MTIICVFWPPDLVFLFHNSCGSRAIRPYVTTTIHAMYLALFLVSSYILQAYQRPSMGNSARIPRKFKSCQKPGGQMGLWAFRPSKRDASPPPFHRFTASPPPRHRFTATTSPLRRRHHFTATTSPPPLHRHRFAATPSLPPR